MKQVVVVAALIAATAAVPVHADTAVKFLGELEPNVLSAGYAEVVDGFFDSDPRDRSDFACFEGGLLDLRHGREVGVGVDCLSIAAVDDFTSGDTTGGVPDFGPISNTADVSLAIDAVTFFFFPGGSIVNDGSTTVRPFFAGVGNGDGSPDEGSVTHLTGSIPGSSPSIVAATGRFSRLANTGNVRLSGAVNLGLDGAVFFSCLFVIQENDDLAF